MRTAKIIGKVIAKVGKELVLEKESGIRHFKAYLNPICSKGEFLEPTEAGKLDDGKWLLLCPINAVTRSIETGDIISAKGEKFCVESLRKVYLCDREAHIWGIAVAVAENILFEEVEG